MFHYNNLFLEATHPEIILLYELYFENFSFFFFFFFFFAVPTAYVSSHSGNWTKAMAATQTTTVTTANP